MNVLVDTDEGIACICGDVVYDVRLSSSIRTCSGWQLDPAVTGNHGGSKRGEKARDPQGVIGTRFILPAHDRPAVLDTAA